MKSDRKLNNILVTGGAGFIGTNFIRFLFEESGFNGKVINADKLTYAGNRENLRDIEKKLGKKRYKFIKADICNKKKIRKIIISEKIDTVVHFAAESHVDRSITGPSDFIHTNIMGTFTLLDILKDIWNGRDDTIFYHISTDEVYGSLGSSGYFYENTPYDPKSPYSASKASSDHLVRSYVNTYGFPAVISNCSNNYGPYQYPEKLIPLVINRALRGEALPVYGDGSNVRDWLFVKDHCSAILSILRKGRIGETYNIGGESEMKNIDVVKGICSILDVVYPVSSNEFLKDKNRMINSYSDLITFVKDRPGHDRRYAVNCDKLKDELRWKPSVNFDEGLNFTVKWYLKKFKLSSL
jgi:dTDP-glucose 4,6-dehydratase